MLMLQKISVPMRLELLTIHCAPHGGSYWTIPIEPEPAYVNVTTMCLIPSRECSRPTDLDWTDIKAVKWFEQQSREFSAEGIHWLVCHGMCRAACSIP